ncbi:MAG: hypothetical protein ACO2PP_03660 [Thermocrinis sp.]
MKRPLALGLILFSWVYAQPTPMPTSTPNTPPGQPTPVQPTPMPTPTPNPPQMPPTPAQPMPAPSPSPMPPIELKPEDKKIIDLKKKTRLKQTFNEYQKAEKAISIDKLNLERTLLEARYALKAQQYKNKQLELQMSYPYYYNISVSGVVGNMAITNGLVLKDGTTLMGKDKIIVQNGHVYVGGYLVSYPVMENIKYPQVETVSVSSPQLLTGMPSFEGRGPVGVPPFPPPVPPPPPPPPRQ